MSAEPWGLEDWLAENRLAEIVDQLESSRPRWHTFAACRGRGGDVDFFTVAGVEAAVALCSRCPVATPCGVAGVREAGVWGGQPSRATSGGELVPGRRRRSVLNQSSISPQNSDNHVELQRTTKQ